VSDIAVRSAGEAVSKDRLTEDWLAVVIGVLVFALALFSLSGTDVLGWAVTTSVYTDITMALAPIAKSYAAVGRLARHLRLVAGCAQRGRGGARR